MNWDVVPEFMAYQFVAPPDTMFKDIYSVMPGQYVTVNLAADGLAKFGTYWRIDKNFLSANSAPELSRALSHSIDCAFDADRDVGIQLSGGIDSSLITAYSHDVLGYRDLNTYSVTMNDRETRYIDPRSEEKYMRIVNEQFAAHGHYYQYGAEEIRPALLEALWHHEAPLYGPSTCLYLLLAKSIKDKVTVLITGEGADDIFLGYFADWKFNGQPASLFKLFVEEPKMVELFGKNGYDAALAKRLDLASSPRLADMSILERASVLTIETVLHGLLARHDRMFMAQSIEGRPPFCTDQMLLSRFAMNDRDVHFNGIGKYAVKKLAEDYFDEDFVYRKKIGFSAPFGDWCSDPQYWRKYVNDVPEDFIGGFADPSPLRTQRNMPEGKEKWHMQNLNFVFSLTQLHLFHKIFFDATDPLSPDSWQQLVAH
jgi:asparagine synthase (glutamine-hydrolysing)